MRNKLPKSGQEEVTKSSPAWPGARPLSSCLAPLSESCPRWAVGCSDPLAPCNHTDLIWLFSTSPQIALPSKSEHDPTASLPCIKLQLWYRRSYLDKEFVCDTWSKAAFFHSVLDLLTPLVCKSQVTTRALEDKKLWWITETINYLWKGHSFFGNPIKLSSHVDSTFMNMNQRPLWPSSWKLTLKVLFIFYFYFFSFRTRFSFKTNSFCRN